MDRLGLHEAVPRLARLLLVDADNGSARPEAAAIRSRLEEDVPAGLRIALQHLQPFGLPRLECHAVYVLNADRHRCPFWSIADLQVCDSPAGSVYLSPHNLR